MPLSARLGFLRSTGGGGGGGGIAFASAGAVNTGAASGGSAPTSAPSGVVSGDLLVLIVVMETGTAPTTPSGWTRRSNVTDGFSSANLTVYTRIADGTSTDTPTVTVPTFLNFYTTVILRFTGNTGSPFNVEGSNSTTSGTSKTVPTVTTTVNDPILLVVVSSSNNPGTNKPAGYDEVLSHDNNSLIRCWTKAGGTAGSKGGESWSFVSFGATHQASILALK